MKISETIASILLKEKAVFLRPDEPFTWASGIKSPVYCDNRLLISSVESRSIIIKAFTELTKNFQVDVIAGTATAGIPWAAWISQELKLPLVYIRSSSKDHGRQNSIEGSVKDGQKAVLIEDLISTGKSSISAATKLMEAGVQVSSVLSIFSYNFKETKLNFDKQNLAHEALSDFETLAKVAYDERMLDEKALKQVLHWKENITFP
jgi:orotate phosphoribosyltransferase